MLPLRSFTMTIVGLLVCALGIGAFMTPDDIAAQHGSGWLYRQFGVTGVGGTLVVVGVVLLVWGVLGMRKAYRAKRLHSTDITK